MHCTEPVTTVIGFHGFRYTIHENEDWGDLIGQVQRRVSTTQRVWVTADGNWKEN